MKRGKHFLFIFIFVVLLNFASSVDVTTCQILGSADTTYVLQNDVNSTTTCFNITANNVTLDLNGFDVVYGNQSVFDIYYGVYSDKNYTTVRNGSIRRGELAEAFLARYGIYFLNNQNGMGENMNILNNYMGIYLSSSSNNALSNITSSDNYYGIRFESSSNNNTLSNVSSSNNLGSGISFVSSSNNALSNITSSNNNYGIYLESSSNNNTLSNITSSNNLYYGLTLLSSSNNTLSNNNFSNNTYNFASLGVPTLNNIDNTNIVDGSYKIYYNYSVSNYEFNSITASDAGIIFCIHCNNVTLKDLNLSHRNSQGVFFYNTSNSLIQNITSSNNEYGIYLSSSSNNNTLSNITSSNNEYGIYLSSSSNNALSNITSSNNYYRGISLYSSLNNTLSNITTLDNYQGIYLSSSSNNNTLSNIISRSNQFSGIDIYSSLNNTFSNITSSLNVGYGILFSSNSHNNQLSDSLINANNFGIRIYSSNYNFLNNLTIIDNTYDGFNVTSGCAVIFDLSSYNTLNNSQIRRNYNTAFYLKNSYQNNITGNIVENNPLGGLKFTSGSTGNLIYNNFFNSTLNYNESGSIDNLFNTTKTLGTNIVGGDYIGGNFWGFLNGTGFSEIESLCPDSDGDTICDNFYNLGDGSYDYLPLRLISFTLPDLPESVYSSGGSSGSYSSSTTTAQTETQKISISAGGSVSISIQSSSIDIRKINISANTNISNASLTVKGIELENFTIPFPAGNLYKAFSITAAAIDNNQLDNVTIDFRVNKTKLGELNASYENVLLYRIPSNESLWEVLPTVSISEDDLYYYFSSVSSGFSTFLIFISQEEVECEFNQIRCFNKEVQICSAEKRWQTSAVCAYGCDNGKCVNWFSAFFSNQIFIYIVSGAALILLVVLFFLSKKKNIP